MIRNKFDSGILMEVIVVEVDFCLQPETLKNGLKEKRMRHKGHYMQVGCFFSSQNVYGNNLIKSSRK